MAVYHSSNSTFVIKTLRYRDYVIHCPFTVLKRSLSDATIFCIMYNKSKYGGHSRINDSGSISRNALFDSVLFDMLHVDTIIHSCADYFVFLSWLGFAKFPKKSLGAEKTILH